MNGLHRQVLSIIMFVGVMLTPVKAHIQLLQTFNYDQAHHKISQITKQPHAVCVIAFNRPKYLAGSIRSLEQNAESQSIPFYFFLDGGPDAKLEENTAIINQSTIKNKTIICRNRNYGCPKNHIDAKRFMFDWCGFEKVIIMEEDLIVTPSFIHLNLALHTWAKKEFCNVGVVQCWSYCYLSKHKKMAKLDVVSDYYNPWWSFVGYCIDREVWDKISPFLYEYESFVDQIPHTDDCQKQRSKPGTSPMNGAIHEWVKTLFYQPNKIPPSSDKKFFASDTTQKITAWCHSEKFQPNQDMMTAVALMMAGYIKIGTIVNRARHIGFDGITCNGQTFDKKFRPIKLHSFPQIDLSLDTFSILAPKAQ